MTKAFPYHDDCYTWPQVAVVHDKFGATVLNVHCLRDTKRRQFGLVGFIGCDRQVQIDHVAWLADEIDAETIVFKGRGLNDQIVSGLMSQMVEPDPEERPGEWCTFIPVDWPNKTQRRVLRKLYDAVTPGEDFHEEKLAKRLHMPVEEVRQHLRVLADIGLVDEA